ncbi:hypothetical protein PFLUV_G00092840 [Perca fluviatilis]|uniref:Glucose-6-phosphate isomerase n=1 Tax=Perca fluviatilis TaxID=8168 RepID=A0A6A5EW00_PERFL|nr:glucose-6-phosphate isomerase-like [Perca fluviatilis]KAF1386276.1 hypothetical protein PFLUV_G00092840 [Perca fluviatilis]
MSLTDDPNYRKLEQWYKAKAGGLSMRDMFESDKDRFSTFSTTLETDDGDILLDYSKNLINQEVMDMLLAMAKSRGVEEARDKMFSGEKINFTEVPETVNAPSLSLFMLQSTLFHQDSLSLQQV